MFLVAGVKSITTRTSNLKNSSASIFEVLSLIIFFTLPLSNWFHAPHSTVLVRVGRGSKGQRGGVRECKAGLKFKFFQTPFQWLTFRTIIV